MQFPDASDDNAITENASLLWFTIDRLLRESNFRYYPLRQPGGTLLTVMQNIEPENLVVAPNGRTAYVSLPVSHAVMSAGLWNSMR